MMSTPNEIPLGCEMPSPSHILTPEQRLRLNANPDYPRFSNVGNRTFFVDDPHPSLSAFTHLYMAIGNENLPELVRTPFGDEFAKLFNASCTRRSNEPGASQCCGHNIIHVHACPECSSMYEHKHVYQGPHDSIPGLCPNPDCPCYFGLHNDTLNTLNARLITKEEIIATGTDPSFGDRVLARMRHPMGPDQIFDFLSANRFQLLSTDPEPITDFPEVVERRRIAARDYERRRERHNRCRRNYSPSTHPHYKDLPTRMRFRLRHDMLYKSPRLKKFLRHRRHKIDNHEFAHTLAMFRAMPPPEYAHQRRVPIPMPAPIPEEHVGLWDFFGSQTMNHVDSAASNVASLCENLNTLPSLIDRMETMAKSMTAAASSVPAFAAGATSAANGIAHAADVFSNIFADSKLSKLDTIDEWLWPLLYDLVKLAVNMNVADALPAMYRLLVAFGWKPRLTTKLFRQILGSAGIKISFFQDDPAQPQIPQEHIGAMDAATWPSIITGFIGAIVLNAIPSEKSVKRVADTLRSVNLLLPITTKVVDAVTNLAQYLPACVKLWAHDSLPENAFLALFEDKNAMFAWTRRVLELATAEYEYRAVCVPPLRAEIQVLYRLGIGFLIQSAKCRLPVSTSQLLRQAFDAIARLKRVVDQTKPNVVRLGGRRRTPYAAVFFGSHGVGKSSLMPIIARLLAPTDLKTSEVMYTRESGCRYYNGYCGQWCTLWDDFLQKQMTDPENSEVFDWIKAVNPIAYRLNMPQLEDKNKMFSSQMCLATTNVPWVKGNDIRTEAALFRRRHILAEVYVLPEYVIPGTKRVDPTRIPPDNSHYRFNLYDPVDPNRQTTPIRRGLSLPALLEHMAQAMETHFAQEDAAGTDESFYRIAHSVEQELIGLNEVRWAPVFAALNLEQSERQAEYNLPPQHMMEGGDYTDPAPEPSTSSKWFPWTSERDASDLQYFARQAEKSSLSYDQVINMAGSVADQRQHERDEFILRSARVSGVPVRVRCTDAVDRKWTDRIMMLKVDYKDPSLPPNLSEPDEFVRFLNSKIPTTIGLGELGEVDGIIGYPTQTNEFLNEVPTIVPDAELEAHLQKVREAMQRELNMRHPETSARLQLLQGFVAGFAMVATGYALVKMVKSLSAPKTDSVCEEHLNPSGDQTTRHQARHVVTTRGLKSYIPKPANEHGGEPGDTQLTSIINNKILPAMGLLYAKPDFVTDKHRHVVNCVFLTGQLILTVRHVFLDRDTDQILEDGHLLGIRDSDDYMHSEVFDRTRLYDYPDRDLALYQCSFRFNAHCSILKHMALDSDLPYRTRVPACLLGLNPLDSKPNFYFSEALLEEQTLVYNEKKRRTVASRWRYSASCGPGFCAALLLCAQDNWLRPIQGLHIAGFAEQNIGYGTLVTRDYLEEGIRTLLSRYVSVACKGSFPVEHGGIAAVTSPIPNGQYVFVGRPIESEFISRLPVKSAITPSPLLDLIGPHGTEPACLRTNDYRNESGRHPCLTGIEKYGKPPPIAMFDPIIAADVVAEMARETLSWTSPVTDNGLMRVLTLDEAINGHPLIDRIQPLEMATAPGLPYTNMRPSGERGKRFLFKQRGERENGQPLYDIAHKTLDFLYQYRLRKALKSERSAFSVWGDFPKDDRVVIPKIALGKTRVFTIAPVDCTLLTKQFFAMMAAHIEYNFDTERCWCKIGMDVHSPSWPRFAQELASVSVKVAAGDYVPWDGEVPAQINSFFADYANLVYNNGKVYPLPIPALDGILELYKSMPAEIKDWICPEKFARVVRYVVTHEMAHTQTVFMTLLYYTTHGMPSGSWLTAIKNSWDNAFVFRYSWRALVPASLKPWPYFYTNVCNAVVGDDNITAVRDLARRDYNLRSIAQYIRKYGFNLRHVNKIDDPDPDTYLWECTFLKRAFVPIGDCGFWLPQIELLTILDMAQWHRIKSASESWPATLVNARTAQEFAYFYGRPFFEKFKQCLERGFAACPLPPHERVLFSWSDMNARFDFLGPVQSLMAALPAPPSGIDVPQEHMDADVTEERQGVSLAESRPPIIQLEPGPVQFSSDRFTSMPDANWNLDMAAKRWTLKTSALTWEAPTNGAIAMYSVPFDFVTSQLNSIGFERFEFVHFDSCTVRVQVNGTRFHSGLLAVYFVPCQVPQSVVADKYVGHPTNWTALNPIYLSASAINTGTLEIPFRNIVFWLRNNHGTPVVNFIGTLVIEPYTALRGPDSSPSLPISVVASFEGAKFNVPSVAPRSTLAYTNRDRTITTHPLTERAKAKPRSNLDTFCQVTPPHNAIAKEHMGSTHSTQENVTNEYAINLGGGSLNQDADGLDHATSSPTTTNSASAGGGGKKDGSGGVAGAIGTLASAAAGAMMDNPIFPGPKLPVLRRGLPNYANSSDSGVSTQRLTYIPRSQNVATLETFDIGHDEMTFASLYLERFVHKSFATWSTADTTGKVLYSWPVTPFQWLTPYLGSDGSLTNAIGTAPFTPTLVERIALLGPKFWRGTFRMRVIIAKSQFHQGRLGYFFIPNTAQVPLNVSDIFEVYGEVWEINDTTTEKIFGSEFLALQPYLQIPNGPNPYQNTPINVENFTKSFLETAVGVAGICVVTPLVLPDGVSTTIDLAFQLAGNPDLSFKFFNTQNQSFAPDNLFASEMPTPPAADDSDDEDEVPDVYIPREHMMEDSVAVATQIQAAATPADITPGLASGNVPKHDRYYRETITTTKELLRRYVPFYNFRPVTTGNVGTAPIVWSQSLLHAPPLFANKNSLSVGGPGLFPMIATHFGYWNGSLDWNVNWNLSTNVYGPQPFTTYVPNIEQLYSSAATNKTGIATLMQAGLGIWTNSPANSRFGMTTFGSVPLPYEMTNSHALYTFAEAPMAIPRKACLLRPYAALPIVTDPSDVTSTYANYYYMAGQTVIGIVANQATGPPFFAGGDVQAQVMVRAADDFRFGGFIGNPAVNWRAVISKSSTGVTSYLPVAPDTWTPVIPAAINWRLQRPKTYAREAMAEEVVPGNFNSFSGVINGEVKVGAISPDCFISVANWNESSQGTYPVTGTVGITTAAPLNVITNSGSTTEITAAAPIATIPDITITNPIHTIPQISNPLPVSVVGDVAVIVPNPLPVSVPNPLPVSVSNEVTVNVSNDMLHTQIYGYNVETTEPVALSAIERPVNWADAGNYAEPTDDIIVYQPNASMLISCQAAPMVNSQTLYAPCFSLGNMGTTAMLDPGPHIGASYRAALCQVATNPGPLPPDAIAEEHMADRIPGVNYDILQQRPTLKLEHDEVKLGYAKGRFAITSKSREIRVWVNGVEWRPKPDEPLPLPPEIRVRTADEHKSGASSIADLEEWVQKVDLSQCGDVAQASYPKGKFTTFPQVGIVQQDSESEEEPEKSLPMPCEIELIPLRDFTITINQNTAPHRLLAATLLKGPHPNAQSALHNFVQGNGSFALKNSEAIARPGVPNPLFTVESKFYYVVHAQNQSHLTLASSRFEAFSKRDALNGATRTLFDALTQLYESAGVIVATAGKPKIAG